MAELVIPDGAIPLGYQQLTSITSSTALSVPAGAKIAVIGAETQGVRWRDDGTAPTGSIGMLLNSGDTLIHPRPSAIRLIQATSGAICNVSYY